MLANLVTSFAIGNTFGQDWVVGIKSAFVTKKEILKLREEPIAGF